MVLKFRAISDFCESYVFVECKIMVTAKETYGLMIVTDGVIGETDM
jgi:hypothetical protein